MNPAYWTTLALASSMLLVPQPAAAQSAEPQPVAPPTGAATTKAPVDDEQLDWDRIFGAESSPPAGGPTPTTPTPGPAIEPAPAPSPSSPDADTPPSNESSGTRTYAPEQEETIRANRQKAIEVYESLLDDDEAELANITKRLEANEKLAQKYRAKLSQAEQKRRFLQVDFLNRTLQLKQQYEESKLSEEMFASLVEKEDSQYASRIGEVESDVAYYDRELAASEARVQDLSASQDRLQAMRPLGLGGNANAPPGQVRGAAPPPPPPLHARLIGEMSQSMRRISGFRTRHTMDHPSTCDACLRAEAHGQPPGLHLDHQAADETKTRNAR